MEQVIQFLKTLKTCQNDEFNQNKKEMYNSLSKQFTKFNKKDQYVIAITYLDSINFSKVKILGEKIRFSDLFEIGIKPILVEIRDKIDAINIDNYIIKF